MLDLDIFDENVFEAVSNNAMSKFLPTNADEFFGWYLGIYAENKKDKFGLTEEHFKVINDIKKYYKVIENIHVKDITCYVNKDRTISTIEYKPNSLTKEYAEKIDKTIGGKKYYESKANYLIYGIIKDMQIKNANDNNETITEKEFFQYIIDNYKALLTTSDFIPTTDDIDKIKSYIDMGYVKFRKIKRPYSGYPHAYSINKSMLVKSTISNMVVFKTLFGNILWDIRSSIKYHSIE